MFSPIDLQNIHSIKMVFAWKNPLSSSEKVLTGIVLFVMIILMFEALFRQWYFSISFISHWSACEEVTEITTHLKKIKDREWNQHFPPAILYIQVSKSVTVIILPDRSKCDTLLLGWQARHNVNCVKFFWSFFDVYGFAGNPCFVLKSNHLPRLVM